MPLQPMKQRWNPVLHRRRHRQTEGVIGDWLETRETWTPVPPSSPLLSHLLPRGESSMSETCTHREKGTPSHKKKTV